MALGALVRPPQHSMDHKKYARRDILGRSRAKPLHYGRDEAASLGSVDAVGSTGSTRLKYHLPLP